MYSYVYMYICVTDIYIYIHIYRYIYIDAYNELNNSSKHDRFSLYVCATWHNLDML